MLVNAGHKPFDTRIFQKEAISLIAAGFNVSIIIPYHENTVRDGVAIEAVPLPDKGWKQLVVCPWNIFLRALKHPRQAVYHLHDSELLVIGLLLKLFGRRVVYDAHEDTPRQIKYQHWIPAWIKGVYAAFYFFLEKLAGLCFDFIIAAEPVIAKYYPSKKTVLIRNFSRVDSFKNYPDAVPYAKRKKSIIYVGLLSRPRGLFEMLEAYETARVQDQELRFDIGGKFSPQSLEGEVLKQYHINFLGWIPYEKLPGLLYESMIGIIIPQPNPRYTTNYPVKLFEYMAAGLPVIASKFGEAAAFVKECNGGLLVDPANTKEVSNAILWLLNHAEEAEAMGNRGQEMIFKKYNWETESAKLISLYQSMA